MMAVQEPDRTSGKARYLREFLILTGTTSERLGAMCRGLGRGAGKLGAGQDRRPTLRIQCATCHKSPQSVTKTTAVFGLESFLREHYTTNPEAAAAIAAYLKGLEKPAGSPRDRVAKRTSQAKPSKPTPSVSKEDESPLDTVQRAMKGLLQTIMPEKSN